MAGHLALIINSLFYIPLYNQGEAMNDKIMISRLKTASVYIRETLNPIAQAVSLPYWQLYYINVKHGKTYAALLFL